MNPSPQAGSSASTELLQGWLSDLASSDTFMPHGHCYLWKPELVGVHVLSDTLIGVSYFGISLLLYLMVRRVRLPFSPMFLAFGIFIAACGATHLVEVWNVWHGDYWMAGVVKAVTAIASVATAFYLVPVRVKVLALTEEVALAEKRRLEIERKNAEIQELLSYQKLAEVLPQIVWTALPDGQVDYYNQRWHEFTGKSSDEAKGWGWQPVIHPEDLQRCVETWKSSLATGAPFEVVVRFRRGSDGAFRWHLNRALPVRDKEGRIAKWFGTATDIHDSKLREEEARHVSEFQERLAGIVSHDVRSPTTAILTTTGMLLAGATVEGTVRRGIERIDKSARRIEKLIQLLLDFTRARLGGGLPLVRRQCDAHEVVRLAAEEARMSSPGPGIEVEAEGTGVGPWDPDRLAQLLSNLLDNARKYGSPGVPIQLKSRGTPSELVIEVWNSGPPIPDALRPHLFEPFRPGAQTESTVKLSLGLGLYIVQEVARGHGGTVEVESSQGGGTAFRVRLPRVAPEGSREVFR